MATAALHCAAMTSKKNRKKNTLVGNQGNFVLWSSKIFKKS